jgi:lipopolysaccharide/colanic/teichoic acid biosynthesis glycosyltransferase
MAEHETTGAITAGGANATATARRIASGARSVDEALKRAFDLVSASIGLILLSPLMVCCALAVLLSSGRPIVYYGVRTGRYGVPFRLMKFRTMRPDSEALGGSTGKDDPRVTRVGRLLRRTKLDELPQLLNVIRGDMSLVGPRPELPQYTALYSEDQRVVLTVRPGITDYSSLHFIALDEWLGSQDVDATYETRVLPEKNRLRVHYARTRSLWVDGDILLRTLARLVRRTRPPKGE